MAGLIPADTVEFLHETGVAESIVVQGIRHAFDLRMEPVLNGEAFSVGRVDDGWYAMAVLRRSGHFGYVFAEAGQPPWVFCNSSLGQFVYCVAATEHLWEMEASRQIAFEARGEFLEREIRKIDPIVFDDPNNVWAFLVEELRNGVV